MQEKFLAGDDEAYARIYQLYARELYAFGLSLKAPSEVIEDAVHDIFVDIHAKRANLLKVNNLKLYLTISFRNRLFFLLNKSNRSRELLREDMFDLSERDYEDIWIERETEEEKLQLIGKVFAYLNDNQREAIYHRYIEGLSCEEISRIMNINYQSVKNLIHRSIKKIKSVLITGIVVFLTLFC